MSKYKYFGTSKQPYEFKECQNCSNKFWILKTGKFCSQSCSKQGSNNPNYRGGLKFKGTMEEYKAYHHHVKRKRGIAKGCKFGCSSKSRYHWANLTGKYEDPNDYIELCPSHHYEFDSGKITLEQLMG